MKGIAKVGAIMRLVPGGSANLPSSVTQINRFCLECLTSDDRRSSLKSSLDFGDLGWKGRGASEAIALDIRRRRIRHPQLIGIILKPESEITQESFKLSKASRIDQFNAKRVSLNLTHWWSTCPYFCRRFHFFNRTYVFECVSLSLSNSFVTWMTRRVAAKDEKE